MGIYLWRLLAKEIEMKNPTTDAMISVWSRVNELLADPGNPILDDKYWERLRQVAQDDGDFLELAALAIAQHVLWDEQGKIE
jgi:hypothetical protein